MDWDKKYESNERIWGEQPSELVIAAVRYLQKCRRSSSSHFVDINRGR